MSAHVAETAQLLFLLCGPFPMPAGFTTLFCVSVKHFTERRRGFPRKSTQGQIPSPGSQKCVKDYFIVTIDGS